MAGQMRQNAVDFWPQPPSCCLDTYSTLYFFIYLCEKKAEDWRILNFYEKLPNIFVFKFFHGLCISKRGGGSIQGFFWLILSDFSGINPINNLGLKNEVTPLFFDYELRQFGPYFYL